MRQILLFLVLYFQTSILFSQSSIPIEQIDSLFENIHVSDNDWVVSLSIDQAGAIPLYDSLGNRVYDNRQGTFLLLKIGGDYFLQKLYTKYFDHPYREKLVIANRLKLNNHIDFDYTVDSILLANTQWIYPFVYKDESLKVYNIQQPADHEPYYGMHFKIIKKKDTIFILQKQVLQNQKHFCPAKI